VPRFRALATPSALWSGSLELVRRLQKKCRIAESKSYFRDDIESMAVSARQGIQTKGI
jgi:hypothetical protein